MIKLTKIMLCGVFFIAAGTVSAQGSNNAQFDSGTYYRLTSQFLGEGKSLDVTNDDSNTVVLGDTGNYSGQFWRIEKLDNGYHRLTTQFKGQNLSLDVINDGTNNRLRLAQTGNYSGQFWKIDNLNNGYYRLTTAFQGEGKSLDVINDGQKRNVQLAPTGNYSGQFWKITDINSNSESGNEEFGSEEPGNEDFGGEEPGNEDFGGEEPGSEGKNEFTPIEGYTGPTTKTKLTVALPFAKAQELTVEVANDGTVIYQRDMILGHISDLAQYNPPSYADNSTIPNIITAVYNPGYGQGELTLAANKGSNSRLWPNSTIPYVLPASHGKKDVILAGIKDMNSKTNLCVVPRTNQTDYVEFVSKNGHWSKVGRTGGRQEISIDQSDPYVPADTVAHELIHAASFGHMQSREDRDKYVTINSRNILKGKAHNFEKVKDKSSNIGPYDFTSVMHYHAKAFSNNRRNTIDVKGDGDSSKMGGSDLSAGDIAGIATLYDPGPCKPAGFKPTATKPTATKPTATKPAPTTPAPTTPAPTTPAPTTPAPTTPAPTTPAPTTTTQPSITPPTRTGSGNEGNIAIGKKAKQGPLLPGNPSTADANNAIDGNTDGRFNSGSVTQVGEGKLVSWEVDLGADYDVSKIVIWNRTDECCSSWQQDLMVATSDGAGVGRQGVPQRIANSKNGRPAEHGNEPLSAIGGRLIGGRNRGNIGPLKMSGDHITVPINRRARFINIYKRKKSSTDETPPGLSLAEVQVFGTPVPTGRRRR